MNLKKNKNRILAHLKIKSITWVILALVEFFFNDRYCEYLVIIISWILSNSAVRIFLKFGHYTWVILATVNGLFSTIGVSRSSSSVSSSWHKLSNCPGFESRLEIFEGFFIGEEVVGSCRLLKGEEKNQFNT